MRIVARVVGQHQRAVGRQALAEPQAGVVFQADAARAEQREVIETAPCDGVDAQPAVAIHQRRIGRAGGQSGRQVRWPLQPADHQVAVVAHRVLGQRVFRRAGTRAYFGRFQRDLQRAAGRARAARAGPQFAVKVEAVVRGQRDIPAAARERDRAGIAHVEHGGGARGIEHGALAHDDEAVGSRGRTVAFLDLAADHDAAAVAHDAVAPALRIERGRGRGGHVDHRLLAEPDRAAVRRVHGVLLLHAREVEVLQRDAAAVRLQPALQRELPDAAHVDGLAGVNRDLRIRTNDRSHRRQVGRQGLRRARLQAQARARALREHALDGILGVERRRPGLQRFARVKGGRDIPGFGPYAQHRHRHLDLRAVGHRDAAVTDESVAAEALVEEAAGQHQRASIGRNHRSVVDEYLAGLQAQRAATRGAPAAQRAIDRQHALATAGLSIRLQPDVAALAAALRGAVGQQGRTRRHVDDALLGQQHVAAAADRHAAAIAPGHRVRIDRIDTQVAPQAARVQCHALGHRHARAHAFGRGDLRGVIEVIGAGLRERVTQADAAAVHREVRAHPDLRAVERDVAAIAQRQRRVHRDRVRGRNAHRTQREAVQQRGVEGQCVLARGGQRRREVEPGGDAFGRVAQHHVLHACGVEPAVHQAGVLVVEGTITADHQLPAARHRHLRLVIPVESGLRRLRLTASLEGVARDVALDHRTLRPDH